MVGFTYKIIIKRKKKQRHSWFAIFFFKKHQFLFWMTPLKKHVFIFNVIQMQWSR